MRKISILIDQFYKHGGIEKLVALKANYWSNNYNHEVSILSTEQKNKEHIYILDQNVGFVDLNVSYKRKISYFSPKNLLLLLKNIYQIQKHLLKINPDYVIVASHIPITYALPFLIKRKTKLIKEIHFTQYYRSKAPKSFKTKLFKFIENKYHSIVVLSSEEKTFYDADNIVVIPNPVIKGPVSSIRAVEKKENIAITIARIAPVKRIELLIEIWKKLVQRGINWKLHIYGDENNPEGEKIRNSIQKSGLQEFILLKGVTDDVYKAINESKVTLLVSEQECFPMLILESFSMGVPVISFDCPTGPRNIISNNKNGLLVENNKLTAFTNTLEEFTKNLKLQNSLSKEALKSSNLYSIESIMNMWQLKVFKK